MIEIIKSPEADSRSARKTPTVEELTKSTYSHKKDVSAGLQFVAELLRHAGDLHDNTKISMINEFHAALTSGKIKETEWYQKHITQERHHLKSHVPEDVNLVDVLEHLIDCTMAGLARSGEIYDVDLSPELLELAARNTVELIKKNTTVVESDDLLDQPIGEDHQS